MIILENSEIIAIAKLNVIIFLIDMSTVREYWESLCEIPGGYEKAQEIWLEIKPLYERLHEFIINRLVVHYGPEAGQNYTPSYLLGNHISF